MQQQVPLCYYQNLLRISLSQQIQETILSGQIYYRRQDPHIRNLNTDLLQLPTGFFKSLKFCQLGAILAHTNEIFEKKDNGKIWHTCIFLPTWVLPKLRTFTLQVTAEGGGGRPARWKQCSHDMAGTHLHSVVFKLNSSQSFLTAEEQTPHYNKRSPWYAWSTTGNNHATSWRKQAVLFYFWLFIAHLNILTIANNSVD